MDAPLAIQQIKTKHEHQRSQRRQNIEQKQKGKRGKR